MKNLEIRIEMKSPIEIPKFPIHLDGLLYWSIVDAGGDESMLDSVLAKNTGIYCASSMRILRSTTMPCFATTTAHPTVTTWEDYPYSFKKKTIIEKGGPFRKRMTKHDAISACIVDFHAVGDPEKIQYLLKSLGFIGLSNRQGFGEIGEIQIDEISNDYSFFDENNRLARVLPIEHVEDPSTYLQVLNTYRPNYKAGDKTICCLPNFRQKTIY